MTKLTHRLIFLLVSAVAGALLMWWTLSGFDPAGLAVFFGSRTNYVWITLTLAAGVAANVLRSLRWRMLLTSAKVKITVRRSIELVFIAYLINSVTPRLGEVVRALLVRRGNSEISSRALGTVVIEKAADVLCLLLVVTAAVLWRGQATASLFGSSASHLFKPGRGLLISLGCLVVLVGVCLLPAVRHKLRGFFSGLWQGVSAIAHLHSPIQFVALCGGIWLCNFLQLYLLLPCFEALDGIGIAEALYLFAVASVGVLLPTPAGAGPWHYAVVRTLTAVFGIGRQAAQSYALITHGLKTVLVMLLGIAGYASYYSYIWRRWRR